MLLTYLTLQNFRSYTKSSFTFHPETTYIVGKNTAGKTNLIEAIFLLATGKSFHAEKDIDVIRFGAEIARIKGTTTDTELEMVITPGMVSGKKTQGKKYLVNSVPKRRVDFAGNITAVLFSPLDLELVDGSPGKRRRFLDFVLEQTDREYRIATTQYEKALRQRNALLHLAKETGRRSEKQFEYWDALIIKEGSVITEKRAAFLEYVNNSTKDVCNITVDYDKSVISWERLAQYKEAEMGSGVTLVGPHRDDFIIQMKLPGNIEPRTVSSFGSRGQQRLTVLQLKLLQLSFMEQALSERPILLLDDIFSELDSGHIELVTSLLGKQQSIVTTTHEEFVAVTTQENIIHLDK